MASNSSLPGPIVIGSVTLPEHLLADTAWAALGRTFLSYSIPIYEAFGGSGMFGGMLTFVLFSFVVFWSCYLPTYNFYRAIDKYNFLGLQKYKMHPAKFEPQELNDKVTYGLKHGSWKGAIRNAFFYYVFFWWSDGIRFTTFPTSPYKMVLDMAMAYVLNDSIFYFFHRMCHHPRFYKYLHKQHHEYKISNVGATAWNNPEESLGIMVIAWSSVLLVGGFDLFTWCVWLWWVNLMDHWVHAGYDFPYDPIKIMHDPYFHDFHHHQNTGAYSSLMFLDWVFGTDRNYRAWQQRRKERLAKGLEEEAERRDDDKDTLASAGWVDMHFKGE